MHLIGIDIGYSQRRRSNGIAVFRDGELQSLKGLGVDERNEALRSIHDADVVAIDAPLLPAGAPDTLPRHCERVFSRGVFQKRCKPGMSHVRGTGQSLRAHGRMAAEILIDQRALRPATGSLPRVCAEANIVEAFPNAFLGVVLPEEDFVPPPTIKPRGKFDWLYDRWRSRGLFRTIVAAAQLPEEIAARCEDEPDHDLRRPCPENRTGSLSSSSLRRTDLSKLRAPLNFDALGCQVEGDYEATPGDERD
jgi:hypothetical protein